MRIRLAAISLLLLLSRTVLTQESRDEVLFEKDGYRFPYALHKADKTRKLPKELVEISGLSWVGHHRLACVQDEKGKIYLYNFKKGQVERKIRFADKGDFEAIEVVDNDAWVLKSNGKLYRVKNFLEADEPKVHKYATGLSAINNTEGLAYDPFGNSLLIACKGYPFAEEKDDGLARRFKAVHRFDPETKKTDDSPALLIALDSIRRHKNYNTLTRLGIDLLAFFDPAEGDVSFQPSGLAVHPVNGNLYVLAAVGNLLAVFSPGGELLALIHLRSKVHPQPEGICFSPGGNLYISNEGKDGKGTILKFKPLQQP